MMKYYIFEHFKLKSRILPKKRRHSESPRHNPNLKKLGFSAAAKKRSTLANINKYTSRILSYFVIKDKNLIRKKSSKIDQNTNPRYLKLRIDHKRAYDAQSKDEVLEKTFLEKQASEQKALEAKKQRQRIIYQLKKNKNYFIEMLRDLNKTNQNCVKAIGPASAEIFSPAARKPHGRQLMTKTSRKPSEACEAPEKPGPNSTTAEFREKDGNKTHLALVPSHRMRNSHIMKIKMSTQIDDNEAYVLTFRSSPSSNSRSLSKSQTHTYSVLGHSGSKVVDNTGKNSIGMGLMAKIRNRTFKVADPEFLFMRAVIQEPVESEGLFERERYVEENMNYRQKYVDIMVLFYKGGRI